MTAASPHRSPLLEGTGASAESSSFEVGGPILAARLLRQPLEGELRLMRRLFGSSGSLSIEHPLHPALGSAVGTVRS